VALSIPESLLETPQDKAAKRGDPLWARLVIVLGAFMMLAGGGLMVAVKMANAKLNSTITHTPMIDSKSEAFAGSNIDGAINILLVGLDVEQRADRGGILSDTIIILHVPKTHDQAYLLSLPRDTRVQIPASPALGTKSYTAKINSAFGTAYRAKQGTELEKRAAGMSLLADTVYAVTHIKFNAAMLIDFDGFRGILDALGGVDLCVDRRAESIHLARDVNGNIIDVWYDDEAGKVRGIPPGGTRLVHEPGCRHFTPQLALDYSRIRKSLPNGDYDRQVHQQHLIKAILKKAMSRGVLTDLGKVDKLIEAGGQMVIVDTGGVPMLDFIFTLKDIPISDLVMLRTNPGTFESEMIGGISYVHLSAASEQLFRSVSSETVQEFVMAHPEFLAAEPQPDQAAQPRRDQAAEPRRDQGQYAGDDDKRPLPPQ
jgi:LCP family protein required for cell wall assembly